MNTTIRRRLFLFLALFHAVSVAGALGQDTSFNPLGRDLPLEMFETQIRLTLEWYELPLTEYVALMDTAEPADPSAPRSANDGPLRKELWKLIEQEKAELLETSTLVARSGQRAQVESISEVIYPTEFDPPSNARIDNDADNSTNVIDEGSAKSILPLAAAFETRNVGTTVEFDPVLGPDNSTIDLNMAPEIIYFTGRTNWGTYVDGESRVEVEMPVFYTLKITTQTTLRSGEYTFIGSQSPRGPKIGTADRKSKVMLFARANVIYTGLPLERPLDKKEEGKPAGKKAKD